MIRRLVFPLLVLAVAVGLTPTPDFAQAPTPPPPASATPPDAPEPTQPGGKILFSRDADSQPAAQPAEPTPALTLTKDDPLHVTDAERDALTFTAYDLDLHLNPASAAISARAALTVKNDSSAPLPRLVLEITSSLHWDAFSAAGHSLIFVARLADTDADHTGQVQEAVVTLPKPLAPGASFTLTALYSGAIPQSATRLERIGAPPGEAATADWDAISTEGTALRGFGNVLWYPVATPPLFLGDGARLFQAIGRDKLRESTATVRLRLAIEYLGDPPDHAFFCGRRVQLTAISDNADAPAAESPGIATAVFSPQPMGFRALDLFVTSHPATETGTSDNPTLIAAVTDHDDAIPAYKAAATLVEPLLKDWLGAGTQTALTILDHPGKPFEDDALLVRPMAAVNPETLTPSMVHSLTHAWIHSSHPWIDEGLAQFFAILWIERTDSRAAALAALQDAARPLALAEPEAPASAEAPSPAASDSSSSSSASADSSAASAAGASLAAATGEVFYRTKAAAVWWMLRGIVGDEALKQALQAYRSDPRLDADPEGFQRTLEKASHKDLRWFFNDWVYRDRGLPDLSIVNIAPSQLDTRGGLPAGWLIGVTVRNDGYAAAEVPVTVRSGTAMETMRLRISGQSTASTRVVFAGRPEQVIVNDGGVPEVRTSIHTRDLVLPAH